METITAIGTAFVVLAIVIINYFKWCYKYWEKKSVPFIEPSFPFGNSQDLLRGRKGLGQTVKATYDYFKSIGAKHGGTYFVVRPMYFPIDPDLVKHIMSKDFQNFSGHGMKFDEKVDPLSSHLFNLDGERWKHMRVKLTPTFTSGKMKMMFQTLLDCGVQMKDHMDKLAAAEEVVDIKEILGCFTTDIIGSCAFGLECNSFKDPDAEFRKNGRKIFEASFLMRLTFFLSFCFPKLITPTVQKDISDFFIGAIDRIVRYRKSNGVKRNDFVQILLDLDKNSSEGFTVKQMAAQAFVFFLAGFETSSTTMTFCLYELARDKVLQQKVRDEVKEAMKKHDGKLTYDAIMEMKFMDQVINETLRKYPPVNTINRVCTKEYVVPGTDVVIEKDTKVFISVLGLHRDPEHYPDPEKFDPSRFTEENVAKRRPFTFIPFGEGPRLCIGLRFGLMQTKVGLSLLLTNYLLSVNSKTQEPLELDPKAFIMAAKGAIWLDIKKITNE